VGRKLAIAVVTQKLGAGVGMVDTAASEFGLVVPLPRWTRILLRTIDGWLCGDVGHNTVAVVAMAGIRTEKKSLRTADGDGGQNIGRCRVGQSHSWGDSC
jgi:hypothetical protein